MTQQATVHYWPSARRGGRTDGHIAVELPGGRYLSHMPDMTGEGERVGVRHDVPGRIGVPLIIRRWPSVRHRSLANDLEYFGRDKHQTLVLPAEMMVAEMTEAAKGLLLVSAPDEAPLHGPLPYYQLADSVKGAGDRSQCATTTAACIARGFTLKHQELSKLVSAQYEPDRLWDVLNEVCAQLGGG